MLYKKLFSQPARFFACFAPLASHLRSVPSRLVSRFLHNHFPRFQNPYRTNLHKNPKTPRHGVPFNYAVAAVPLLLVVVVMVLPLVPFENSILETSTYLFVFELSFGGVVSVS